MTRNDKIINRHYIFEIVPVILVLTVNPNKEGIENELFCGAIRYHVRG
jgi:hypothetical protein